MTGSNVLYVGMKGRVLALDRATGTEIWRAVLKSGDFVNVVLSEGDLLAATGGELFCLDPVTGAIRWHNRLKGLGLGLVTIAPAPANVTASAAKRKKDAQAAAAASTIGV